MATSPCVLVVDDDEMIRESLIEALGDHGYAARGASDGREALDLLRAPEPAPCLIILDLMMPVMDGREFREAQLADPALSQIPVVVVSANRDLQRICKDLAPQAAFKKPLPLADLLDVVQQHCCP